MDSNAILHEVQQLDNVSDGLDSLAEQHPLVSEALISISGSVRSTASLLEVLVAMKMPPLSGLDPAKRLMLLMPMSEAVFGVETSRAGRHLEVNCEPATRSQRHSR